MKRLPSIMQTLTIVSCMFFFACKQKHAPANADVNPSFEMTPPLAADIKLQLLEKPIDSANVLVSARMDTNLVKSKFHAVMVNGEKLVLRDDGEGGDVKAGDGIFSIALKEDVTQLTGQLDSFRLAAINAVRQKKNLFTWVNRTGKVINEEILKGIDQKFDLTQGIIFNPNFIFTIPPDPLLKDHSLMVTNLGVVEDPTRTFNPCLATGTPNGVWTFGKLMADMANSPATGLSAENFVKGWLQNWLSDQTVNGDLAKNRGSQMFNQVIKPWVVKSNPATPPASILISNWETFSLDVTLAPLKLLAIVNRVDLRGNSGYGLNSPGEGRFVFGVLNSSSCLPLTGPGKFTVILEYGIPIHDCDALKAYAQQWVNLKTLTPGTPAYNNALQAITDQFTAAGAGAPRPNGSSINQVRTNELAIGSPWELREFTIDKATNTLVESTVTKEPAKVFNRLAVNIPPISSTEEGNNLAMLANYINTHEASVINNTNTIPLAIGAKNFLGGKAHTELPTHFWDGSAAPGPGFINSDEARHVFSLNTCSGCHGGEGVAQAPLPGFLHIVPQAFGLPATLSAFLMGDASDPEGLFRVKDPAGRPSGAATERGFNDLERRAQDLESFVSVPCLRRFRVPALIVALSFKPVNMTH
ncbi:MAG: choice-of-anchor X domain-containing protein [Ginsengibacter sp.]